MRQALAIGLLSAWPAWALHAAPKSLPPPAALTPEAIQQQTEELERQRAQQAAQMLDQLKAVDPKAYEQQKAQADRQEQIQQVLRAVRQQQLSVDVAERQLYPLIKAEVEQELTILDSQIAFAQQRLQELQEIKRDPARRVQQRLDQLLGRAQPDMPAPDTHQ